MLQLVVAEGVGAAGVPDVPSLVPMAGYRITPVLVFWTLWHRISTTFNGQNTFQNNSWK
jgi:hypothetical protein